MARIIIMVIAQQGFRDEELLEPKEVFEREGYSVVVVAPQKGVCKGMLGHVVEVTESLDSVSLDKASAFIVVGGANSPSLMEYPKLGELLAQVLEKDMVLGAICLAPMVVASFDAIDGIHATVYPTDDSLAMLKAHGVKYIDDAVVTDGRVVTANGPPAAAKFADAVLHVLS